VIFIVVKWTFKPELSGNWLAEAEEFTQGTRSEPGNI
jgi:quinol monooxygenase YgiN